MSDEPTSTTYLPADHKFTLILSTSDRSEQTIQHTTLYTIHNTIQNTQRNTQYKIHNTHTKQCSILLPYAS
jgi:hypothetical protein